uniref:Pectinesterase n=1 Tax=Hordeum vulgare subsp. vulgare TaxID=112509 RepID=F2DQJ3_HORVV|nr:predicted protein [Hordeum vulgare subsp. vulgare]
MAMAAYHPAAALSFLLVLSLFLLARSDPPPSTPVPPATACNDTTDPTFCRSVLPANGTNNLYTYGRFSAARSLSNANRFLGLVNRYLARGSLSDAAVAALQDCQLLSGLNIDFLSAAGATLNTTKSTLLDPQAEDVQTLLSAILTNQQTCADGLQAAASAWSVRSGLAVPMANSTKLYSISLSLFTRAWVPRGKGKKPRASSSTKPPRQHGRGLFDATDDEMVRRMALEGAAAAVSVAGAVTVDQSGAGNYTTVADAVAAAPSNLGASSGYFVIHVAAGVYEENVAVPKNKKYVMMVGDGIGQTVITGNRSVVDGWTTFNSATFAVLGQGFVAVNMTFRNTAGPAKHQAVALRSGADLSTFYQCSFEGYQDTLYTHSLRQFYRACDVYGTVDYVFGNAAVVFQDCTLYNRLPMAGQSNTVTAQGLRPEPEHGHHHPGLLHRGRAGARRQHGLRHRHLPGEAVEDVLAHGDHAVGRGRDRRPGGVDAVERRLRAQHALLRRVRQLRGWVGHEQEGELARLPCAQQHRRRRQLHRRQHGAR